ncbi:lysylphosphatidylglycerol synthase transmembrane domain-containing protein [Granulicella arctica]|uniref:Flippase-like domain-containing protein n=1 Tax=Granulicella arctica TaxID=940613 RepID=A0A7Y9PJ73_9BACT|nr:lysylphosphatidylglycerol synthase transmembrane domain-containing protein [Granulicella arctica]NYF80837.1 hypothetical protein [Granulicella arctica]
MSPNVRRAFLRVFLDDLPGVRVTDNSPNRKRNLLKTVPGLLISAFFLWYTFKNIHPSDFRTVRLGHPAWIVGVLGFTLASYTLRCVRWTRMMLPTGAGFGVCARVLMTSLAANNILPLRIGDIMRVFTYAGDLGASPSVILSTVILEKLLDIFVLVLLFVSTMGAGVSAHFKMLAEITLGISTGGLLVLIFGARLLIEPLRSLFAKLPQSALVEKIDHWVFLALDCIRQIGIVGSVQLLVYSGVIWFCEGMIFVSAARLLGLVTDQIGPWQAVSATNLSYLIPSSPGGIGTFEMAAKTSLMSHGAEASQAAVFGLVLHAWLLISVTGAGGILFLIHRFKIDNHKPLLVEIETLPVELP